MYVPVLLILPTDYRTTRSDDLAIIEAAVNRVCTRLGFTFTAEDADFNVIRNLFAQLGLASVARAELQAFRQGIESIKSYHLTRLIMVGYIVNEDGHGSGFEGGPPLRTDDAIKNARSVVALLSGWLQGVEIQLLEIRVAVGRVSSVRAKRVNTTSWVGDDEDLEGPIARPGVLDSDSHAVFQTDSGTPDTLLGIEPGGDDDKLVPKT